MEHLDLAGVLTTPPQWNLPAFEQQDALYLSSSRQMLEPIMEETSEDEESALSSWHQYEQPSSDAEGANTEGDSLYETSAGNGGASFWSSAESDTGSVIRIEVTKDNDSTSERDFLCPAKRPRRCEDSLAGSANEDEVILRRPMYSDLKNNSLERFLNSENFSRDSWGNSSQQRSSVGSRKGYDDFYSDSDSLSYNSLSRSSSLIQFESLERQLLMQEQHASMSSLGNSSPSLLSFDLQTQEESTTKNNTNSANNSANNSRRGSQASLLKKYESLDGRLHQTYYDLDKLNFDDMGHTNKDNFARNCNLKLSTHMAELRSDSESSSEGSEGSLRPGSKLLNNDAHEHCKRTISLQSKKGKNSAENLSEDSGYCEPSLGFGLRRTKSQTLLKNYEKFSEEEEEMENKTLVYKAEQEQYQQQKHSNLNEFKNTTTKQENNSIKISPPLSPHLEFIRHKQRNETHSPSPVSSEVSTSSSHSSQCSSTSSSPSSTASSKSMASSSSSSASSTSSATTCASKASFTWLMPTTTSSLNRSTKFYEAEESPRVSVESALTQISMNDLRLAETTNEENVEDFRGKLKRNFIIEQNNTENECLVCIKEYYLNESINDQSACRKCGENIFNERRALANDNILKCQIFQQNNADIETNTNNSDIPQEIKESCQNCGKNIIENFTQNFGERVRKKIIEQQLKLLTDKCSSIGVSGEIEKDSFKRNNLKDSPLSVRSLKYKKYFGKNSLDDQTSCKSTPLAERSRRPSSLNYSNSSDSDYSPLGLRRDLNNLMPSWPIKTSSVPNDLNTIGRKKKHKKLKELSNKTKSRNCSISPEPKASDSVTSCEDLSLEKENIKRSSSWSYNVSCAEESCRVENKNLAILHQSYYNLAKLNFDNENCHLSNTKMSEKRSSSDYETEIVCKNNFLLDELSAHFDRTASILNDKPMEDEILDEIKPQLTSRNLNRKESSTSCSAGEEETAEKEQVQHVQLVIRKPPARQKRAKDEEKANSLTQDYSFAAIMKFGTNTASQKTFDQDPTMLKTSYAQSLEKCNFDCKELSTQDLNKTRSLPKRRFQSQANNAKKKSLVSSTPNLNAFDFDKQDDIEDDLFVSSAHTSMHQLPLTQTQKPLGILLPAGSRTSFGKEVSFCPVVSKYCWQEQSSEECNDNSEEIQGQEEESEDELLDNADATVIHNTKENEIIASKYNENLLMKREQITDIKDPVIKEKAVLKEFQTKQQVENVTLQNSTEECEQQREYKLRAEEESNGNKTTKRNEYIKEQENVSETVEQMVTQPLPETAPLSSEIQTNAVSLVTNVNNETLKTSTDRVENCVQINKRVNNSLNTNLNTDAVTPNARPLSIQLPILSEPPINRAHHILYASQQMLDNFQRQQESEQYEHFKSQSTYNLSSTQKNMSSGKALSTDLQQQQQQASNSKLNNNNEILKSKFKHEEKHPNSKGFLSRFANGFRFSLRRNKKKLQQQQQKENQLGDDAVSNQAKTKSLPANTKQSDFIHIPLKGPLPTQRNGNPQTNGNTLNGNNKNITVLKQKGAKTNTSAATTNDKQKVTGKPPIPPQQQQQMQKLQSAQSSQQQQQQQQQQQPLVEVGLSRFYTETNNTIAYNPRSSTQDFLNTERFYNQQQHHQQQQLNSSNSSQSCANNPTSLTNENVENIQQENCENSVTMTAVNANNTVTYDFSSSSPSRASVSQKTQMFNNLSRPINDTQPKIGLIETNLDTHETIITGKTRSLINIAPQHQQQSRYAGNKRIHHNNFTNIHQRHHNNQHGSGEDEGYDDNDEVIVRPDGTVVVIKNAGTNAGSSSSSASQAAQIASVRRPHKSMEFLLDKENQKDVMVSS